MPEINVNGDIVATNRSIDLRIDKLKAEIAQLEASRYEPTAEVILFKPSGKYYTAEQWRIPADAIGPWDMERSPDARRISMGHIYIPEQEPWGYPHLLLGEKP